MSERFKIQDLEVEFERSFSFTHTHQPHHFVSLTFEEHFTLDADWMSGLTGFELCSKAGEIHRTAEASDRLGNSVAQRKVVEWLIDDHH